jgi:hypothetical protein
VECGIPRLVRIQLHLVLGHLFLREVVTFIHRANKVKHFGLIGDNDVDCAVLLLNFRQLTTKRDDMSGAGYPCVVECLGGICAFLGHHLTPIGAKVCGEGLYCLVGVAKGVLIELLNILLINAVNDALYTYVGDGLLKLECLLKILCFCLEAEEFALGSVVFDGWIDHRSSVDPIIDLL